MHDKNIQGQLNHLSMWQSWLGLSNENYVEI